MRYYISDLSETADDMNICTGATAINGATLLMDGLTPNRPNGFIIPDDGTKTGNNSELIL